MCDENDDLPLRFPPALTEDQQWSLLKRCLEDEDLRNGRFRDCLIMSMNKRMTVNIKNLAAATAEHLGEQYGVWVEVSLRDAAKMTKIIVNGDESTT